MRTFLNSLKTSRDLLLAGALLGAAAAACDPKQIGDETAGNVTCEDGETKPAEDGCNTCTCTDGEWGCTEKGCEPAECEDGETKEAGDGCNTCSCVGNQWACTLIDCQSTDGPPGVCSDGVRDEVEECDDGNNVDGDGCSAICTIEGGETEGTSGAPNETTGGEGVCGDGVRDEVEECDDGNNVDGDGCSSNCTSEGGGSWPLMCPDEAPVDPFTILEVSLVADSLTVQVQYSGGCVEHDFNYCWTGEYAESDPVQIWTFISHEDKDDNCDGLLITSLEFDLAELKANYQQAYQTQNGEISIHLEGWPASIPYTF